MCVPIGSLPPRAVSSSIVQGPSVLLKCKTCWPNSCRYSRRKAATNYTILCSLNQEVPMPLVRIDLRAGTPPSVQRAIADGVHQALVETITIPSADRFQLISEYSADHFI